MAVLWQRDSTFGRSENKDLAFNKGSDKGNLETGRAKKGSGESVDKLEHFFQLFIYTNNTIKLGLRKNWLE